MPFRAIVAWIFERGRSGADRFYGGDMRKLAFKAAAAAVLVQALAATAPASAATPPVAADPAAGGECGFAEDAPIFGVGMAAGTNATPILLPIEQGIVQRGDKSASLRAVPVPAAVVENWTSDYAMMRLSQMAGRPIWAVTENGQPGALISASLPATNLADAFDRIAAQKGMRWRYDGDKVYLLGGREWTVPMPGSRDLALAVQDALVKSKIDARIAGGMIRFHADDEGAAKVSAIVSQVYAQQRLNPYDVRFYKVYPSKGAIDWSTLAERTDAVESVSFDGKGATVVLDPTAGAVVDAFLAREGDVRALGSTTMVSAQANAPSAHAAGCGAQAEAARGLQLAGGAYERGRVSMSYSVLGGKDRQSGTLAVTPGSVVVISDGEPVEGAYMVAVVRPRVIELQTGAPPQVTPAAVPAGPVRPSASVVTASAAR